MWPAASVKFCEDRGHGLDALTLDDLNGPSRVFERGPAVAAARAGHRAPHQPGGHRLEPGRATGRRPARQSLSTTARRSTDKAHPITRMEWAPRASERRSPVGGLRVTVNQLGVARPGCPWRCCRRRRPHRPGSCRRSRSRPVTEMGQIEAVAEVASVVPHRGAFPVPTRPATMYSAATLCASRRPRAENRTPPEMGVAEALPVGGAVPSTCTESVNGGRSSCPGHPPARRSQSPSWYGPAC